MAANIRESLVDVVVEEPSWTQALPDLPHLADTSATAALSVSGLDPEHYTLCLLACGDNRIAELNTEFRGKAQPTNVLSWPAFDLAASKSGYRPITPPAPVPGQRLMLGDVALALQTAQREATAASIPLKFHATHLILHAVLHLLGYDHETREDAELMEGLERQAMEGLGLPDPYAEST